ncbi:MAG: hypothetical protein CMH49_02300 [Myxococcales bacterium]|nr:hypothetical protein [Myxococcales bacterium]
MSGDWRKAQNTPMRQNEKEPHSPFMRTAFGYSPPAQAPLNSQTQPSSQPQLPRLNPQAISYQTERKNTPTSVLMPTSEAPQQLRGRLMTIRGEQRGESWFLNRSHTSLGRALDNDIVLLDIAASRKHAQIIRGTEGFILLDLKSANGIFLNGRRITEEDLYDGDEIEVGETVLKFETVGQVRVRTDFAQDDTDPGMAAIPHYPSEPVRSARPQHKLANQSPLDIPRDRSRSRQLHDQGLPQVIPSPNNKTSSPKDYHLTYGFGSQLSPEDLNISPLPHRSKLDKSLWQERLFEQVQKFKTELTLGRGHRASILRLSTVLSVIIIFFALGQGLSTLFSSSENSKEVTQTALQVKDQSQGSIKPPSVSENSIPKPRFHTVNPSSIQQLNSLLANQDWKQALKLLQEIDQDLPSIRDPRLQSFRNQAEQGLIQQESALIKDSIQKGILGKAQQLLSKLKDQVSVGGQGTLIALDYALWLHKQNLGSLKEFNPPPRERKLLFRAAEAQESGQYRKAQRILKLARPDKSRLPLFTLRKSALQASKKSNTKSDRTLDIKEIELKHLLATSIDIQFLLQRYKAAIEKAIIKTQYKRIAPWLEGAIILSLNQPSQQYFLNKQKKLQREALKWLTFANSPRNANNPSSRRVLLESAIPYLEGPSLDRAQISLGQLR